MRVKKTHETEEWMLRLKGKKGVRVARTSYERHEMAMMSSDPTDPSNPSGGDTCGRLFARAKGV